ncbi:MAG: hypothetical protein PHH84_06840 [Oscillospiraceae bacterium]|nr:hypothetical protein [Oscillospiraceae bacterium]MDD4414478.1 hypothetical protein [Oscillospiraceae bacterium]
MIHSKATVKSNISSIIYSVRYDFWQGIMKRFPVFLGIGFIFLLANITFIKKTAVLLSSGNSSGLSFADIWIYTFRGMEVYTPSENSKFVIPGFWLLLQVYFSYLVSFWPYTNISGHGHQVLLRCQSRWKWWIGKCLWVGMSTIGYYLIGAVTLLLCVWLNGGQADLNVHNDILSAFQIPMDGYTASWLLGIFILPVLASLTLGMIQLVLQFCVGPMITLIIAVAILVSSAFFSNPLLIGNQAMIWRYAFITPHEIDFLPSLIIDAILIIAAFILGGWRFSRYDIL